MADDSMQIVIGADTSGLAAGAAATRSEAQKIVEALAILQRSVHATSQGMTSDLVGAINGLKGNLSSVGPAAQGAAREMMRFHEAAAGGGKGGGGHGAGAGRLLFEVHALFDELSSGRAHQAIGTFSNLEFILGRMNPMFAVAAGGAVALGAGIFLTVEHFKELQKTFDDIRQSAAFSRNFQIVDPKALDEAAAKLRDLKSIWNTIGLSDKGFSEGEIAKVTSSFAQMGVTSNETIQGMALAMSTMWQQFGSDEKGAAKNIIEVFAKPLAPIDEIAKRLHGLTDEERARIKAAQDSESSLKAQAAIYEVLAQRERNSTAARAQGLRDQIAAQQQIVDKLAEQDGAANAFVSGQTAVLKSLQDQLDAVNKTSDALDDMAKKMRNALEPAQNIASAMRDWTKRADPKAAASENLDDEIKKGEAALKRMRDAAAASGGETPFGGLINSDDYAKASAALDALKAKRDAAFAKDSRKDVEIENLQSQADGRANAVAEAQRLRDQSADYFSRMNKPASDTGEAADLYREALQRKLDDEKTLAAAKRAFAESQVALEIANAGKSVAARTAAELKLNDLKRQGADGDPTKLNEVAAERARIEQQMNDDVARKAADALDRQMDKVRDDAAQKIKVYQDDVRQHTLSAQQGADAEKAVLDQEATDLQALFARKAALYVADSEERQKIERETQKAIRAIHDEEVAEQRQAADANRKQWEQSANQISGAINSQMRALLSGQENFATAAKKILADWALEGIQDAIKLGVNVAAQYAAMGNAATLSGAMQAAAQQMAAGGGIGALVANAAKTIEVEAGQVFAGVAAFLAPIMGPAAIGPASAAYAAVGSHIASADIGMWNVPQDQLALIHHNELIMPAAQAGAFRDMLSGGGRGGGESQGGAGPNVSVSPSAHFHINAMDSQDVERALRGNQSGVMKVINQAVRDGAHLGMRRFNR